METSLAKGAFVLSLDMEMAWGFNHLPAWRRPTHQYKEVRRIVDRLLALMEQYEIAATWATVGHLFLEQCQCEDGVKHPEIVPPEYSWLDREWLEPDPCTDWEHDPYYYGPDLIQRVMECKVPQEIGCHNFSHVIVGDPECSRETFESELAACERLATEKGITLKSFVYPKNRVDYLDLLIQKGYSSYRGPEPCWFGNYPYPLWRVAHKIDRFFPITPPVVFPSYTQGIWNIPGSAYYVDREGRWGKWLPIGMRVWKTRKGLQRAARVGGVFHMWFHPYNLASDMDGLFHGLERIFTEVNRLRDRGVLDNLTMGQLAESLSKESATVKA